MSNLSNHLAALVVSYAVNALWQVPLVAMAAWVAARALRSMGPRAQHIVWVTALVGMVALPAVPRFHWPMHNNATVSMSYDDVDLSSLPPLAPAAHPLWDAQSGIATLPHVLFVTLLCGYLLLAVYFALRLGWWLWRTRTLVREADAIEFSEAAQAVWFRCRDAFLLGEVDMLESSEMRSPVTVGLRPPAVLMPEKFSERASSEELLTALAHECAHVQRKDFIKNLCYELVSLPIAFHPVLWMVKRQIAETREMVCDGMAVERVMDAPRYVRSLLRLAEGVVAPPAPIVAMGMFDGRTLERRIIAMRARRKQLGPVTRIALLVPGLLLLVGVVLGGASLAVGVEAKTNPVTSEPAAATPVAMQTTESAATPDQNVQTFTDSRPLTPEEKQKLQQQIQALQQQVEALKAQTHQMSERAREDARKAAEDSLKASQFHGADPNSKEFQEKIRAIQADVQRLKAEQDAGIFKQQFNAAQDDGIIKRPFQHDTFYALQLKNKQQLLSKEEMMKLQAQQLQLQTNAEQLRKQLQNQQLSKEQMEKLNADMKASQQRFQESQDLWAKTLPLVPNGSFYRGAAPVVAVDANSPQKVSSGIIAQTKISGDDPIYPPIAKAAHVTGAVVMHAVISKEGSVEAVAVISGPQMLQSAAITAVKTWKYKPYLLNGQPTAVETTVTVNFQAAPGAAAQPDGARSDAPIPFAAASHGLIRISGGAIAGSKLGGDNPLYPKEAKANHVQGAVVLHSIISKTGYVENLEVISGPEPLQNAAMDAVKTWKYKPYLLNGEPTEVETTITVNFSINNDPPVAPNAAAVRHVGGSVQAPVLIHQVEPEYSQEARKAKISDDVVVALVVDRQGMPHNVHVVHPADNKGLDGRAIAAVQQYRFKPAMENGNPVPVALSVEVNFQIF